MKVSSKLQFEKVIYLLSIPFFILILGSSYIPYADELLLVLCIGMIVLLIQNASLISNLSDDNPKLKTMKKILFVASILLVGAFILMQYYPRFIKVDKAVVWLFSLIMIGFGNYLPKIPYNRYVGYRLPWTIKDEKIWRKTHRLLGFLAFPIALIQSVAVCFYSAEVVMQYSIMIWILLPGIYSFILYLKKGEQSC